LLRKLLTSWLGESLSLLDLLLDLNLDLEPNLDLCPDLLPDLLDLVILVLVPALMVRLEPGIPLHPIIQAQRKRSLMRISRRSRKFL
jgi:hypothetical protein